MKIPSARQWPSVELSLSEIAVKRSQQQNAKQALRDQLSFLVAKPNCFKTNPPECVRIGKYCVNCQGYHIHQDLTD